MLMASILFLFTTQQMGCKGREGMEPYAKSQQLIDRFIDSLKKPAKLEQKYFEVFKSQQKILSLRKDHYLELGILFFKNYYGVLILLMVYSCIGGVILFLIANSGWAGAGPGLKSLFLAVSLLIAFFAMFPTVFKQKENFDENLKQYMSYTKAELNIIDQLSKLDNPFYATINSIDENNKKVKVVFDSGLYYRSVDSIITLNNNVINNLTNYILNIDGKEVKVQRTFTG